MKPMATSRSQEPDTRRRKLAPRSRGKPSSDELRREDPRMPEPGDLRSEPPKTQKRGAATVPDESAPTEQGLAVHGILELHPQGYGFLRDAGQDYRPTPDDAFVPAPTIETLRLRPGNLVRGVAYPTGRGGPRVSEVVEVDGLPAEAYREVKQFDELTPIVPREWLRLETGPEPLCSRRWARGNGP
jgi:transcription termination factor Rho